MLKVGENIKSQIEQREELLELNNDIIYGVYDLKEDTDGSMSIQLVEDVLTCYPNQLQNIKGLSDNSDISLLDINSLRKGGVSYLEGSEKQLDNPILLSNGVIELINAKKVDGTSRYHTYTTLRDGGAADALQRTGVAGRNSFSGLNEEVEREYTEESPFLSKINGEWTIATPKRENTEAAFLDLENSINYFLENKYNLDRLNPEYLKFIEMFEKSFKGVKYEELGDILREVLKSKKIEFFESKHLDSFPGLENDIKKLSIIDDAGNEVSSGKYFIYHDEANNTIEYRSLREIELPEGFNSRQRLFLESQNQYAKTHRLENLSKDKLVPAMEYFSRRVNGLV